VGNPFDNYDKKGPSADSWHKDGVDMGRETHKKSYQNDNKEPEVQEFKDLFSMADTKIKQSATGQTKNNL
jgi:hypothetical protein